MEEKETYAKLNITRRALSELKPHPQNPRAHPEAQMNHLDRSLEKFGFAKGSICIQKGTDFILAGHAIREAMLKKGQTEADVVELPFDDVTAKQFLIADNKTQDDSEWDTAQLGELMKELEALPDIDLRDTGFDPSEIDELFPETPDFEPVGIDEQPRLDEKKPVVCPECGNEFIP